MGKDGIEGQAVPGSPEERLHRLKAILAPHRRVALAFSGGVDSTFLLAVLARDPERRVLAVTVTSPLFPAREREEARALARHPAVRHLEIPWGEPLPEAVRANPPDRCYHCKRDLFTRILEVAAREGHGPVLDGSNADDPSDYRPGLRALRELGIRSPLMEAGLGKEEIRLLSRRFGLAIWDRPSRACLASRVPYGTPITPALLARIDRCEAFLEERLRGPVRVRAHGEIARIEVDPAEIPVLLGSRAEVVRYLAAQGFVHVTLDLRGYRAGSMNEALKEGPEEA